MQMMINYDFLLNLGYEDFFDLLLLKYHSFVDKNTAKKSPTNGKATPKAYFYLISTGNDSDILTPMSVKPPCGTKAAEI